MRRILGLALIAFTVSVGIVVGNRLSSEAMAVIVGVVCGVFAGVPTAVLLLMVARRMRDPRQERSGRSQASYPPVIVISPNSGQPQHGPSPWYGASAGPSAGYLPPDFRIVGEEDEDEDW